MKLIRNIMVLALALLPLGAGAQGVDYDANLLKAGTKAPDFKLISAQTGDTITLKDLRQQPNYILIDFWASWCPDCRRDIPRLKDLNETYKDYGITCLGVSFDTDSTAWKRCIKKEELNWVHGSELKKWKHGTTIDSLYNVTWIPTMYLVDPDGTIVYATVSIEKMRHEIDSLAAAGAITKDVYPKFGDEEDPGFSKVVEYLKANLRYPKVAQQLEVEGKIKVQFYIGENGAVDNVKIKEEPTFTVPKMKKQKDDEQLWKNNIEVAKQALMREALRVVRQMPDWHPALINGRKARVSMILPVTFRLE